MIKKKEIMLIIIIIALLIIISGFLSYHFYFLSKVSPPPGKLNHPPCLSDDEIAKYEIIKRQNEVSLANIFIENKEKKELFKFQIELPIPDHYHPIEFHKCGVYATRSFNYDYLKKQALANYKIELWRYYYNGEGEPLIFLSGPISGSGIGTDFRVDPAENYVFLERSYLGHPDYALVVKNLETKEDVLSLSLKDITDKHPSLVGSIGLREWTKNGRYFWNDIFVGAYILGFFRIDTTNWKVEIFEVPDGVLGGSALNIEKGYITRHPGYEWTGMDILTEQIKKEWQEHGKKSTLYLYNLFTKEQTLLETTDEPLWFFKPKWISETELEYELSTGEKKIYKIKEE